MIYNGVADCGFAERRTRTGRVGIIGRISPEKGQKVFVRAARELPHLRFVVCGGTQFADAQAQAYFDEVRGLAEGLPVEFTGWRDNVGDVLHTLDLLVVASLPLAEATTRVIPEAYSAGVPVLASDLTGIREILTEGETGFLFPAGDARALAERMREVMDDQGRVAAVTARARQHYEKHFSIGMFQQKLINRLEG